MHIRNPIGDNNNAYNTDKKRCLLMYLCMYVYYACILGMGKMILFRELVLSVQFTITICLFDSVLLIRSLRQITS